MHPLDSIAAVGVVRILRATKKQPISNDKAKPQIINRRHCPLITSPDYPRTRRNPEKHLSAAKFHLKFVKINGW